MEHIRFQALFAILVVTIAGSLPSGNAAGESSSKGWQGQFRALLLHGKVQLAILAAAGLLVAVRGYDLVSDRHYIVHGSVSLFGPGPSWWFPEAATQFIRRERLPGNVFNDFDLGGYLAYRMGPEYPDYVDSRYIPFGLDVLLHKNHLMASPPDSPDWDAEVAARNINLAIFSLSRYGELENAPLAAFCASQKWKPVYLDEVSVVFLRVRPENDPWLRRLALDCSTVELTPPAFYPDPWRHYPALYEFYANAGSVLYVLSRDSQAAAMLNGAADLFPADPNLHLIRGQLFEATNRPADAEHEFHESLALAPGNAAWYALGRLYGDQHRYAEAADCLLRSAELSNRDYDRYRVLGQIYLVMNLPQKALMAFDQAERRSPFERGAASLGVEFHARLAEDRAHAWKMLGDLPKALFFAEKSLEFTPESRPRWELLADLYTLANRADDAARAHQHAASLAPR